MPRIDLDGFDSDFLQMFTGLWYVDTFIASDDTFYTWRTPDGDIVRVTGTGIQTSGDFPTAGIFTKVEIAKDDGDINTPDITITDIQNADFADMQGLDDGTKQSLFWDAVMQGDVTITAPDPGNEVTAFLDKRVITNETFVGDDSTIRGVFDNASTFYSSFIIEGTSIVKQGDIDFVGFARTIAPALFIRDAAIVAGGDDRIIFTESTVARNDNTTSISVFGDASQLNDSAILDGGDDLIDARDAGDGFRLTAYGDAQFVQSGTFLFGGDDIIFGVNRGDGTGTNLLYGDAQVVEANVLIGGDDTIYGRAGNDFIYGDTGSGSADYIGGDDLIFGGSDGADLLSGGNGDDRIYGGKGALSIFGGQGDDKIYVAGGGSGFAVGDAGNDLIRVNDTENYTVYGGEGTDRISFFEADGDLEIELNDETPEDFVVFAMENISGTRDGDNTIIGTAGANDIDTYNGDDSIYGGAGDDHISTRDGDDYIKAGDGNNTYDGGDGRDTISYYNSDAGVDIDLKRGEAEGGFAEGDTILDIGRVTGTRFDDKLFGLDGGNILKGGSGDDSFWGRDGTDKIYGGKGRDFLNGGDGTDYLFGGSGADTFHFDRTEDRDIIKDFQNNADRIEFDGFAAGFDPFDYARQDGRDVVFDLPGADSLTVDDILLGQLKNDVFVI